MRSALPLLLLPLLALSCGGEAGVSYGSPVEAAEAGAAALASGDGSAAIAAYEAAAAATDAAAKTDALTGLFEAQLLSGSSSGALAAFSRLTTECATSLTPNLLNQLATLALNRKVLDVADAVVNKGIALFPAQKDHFAKAVQAVDLLKTQGPGADLSSLGYTGD